MSTTAKSKRPLVSAAVSLIAAFSLFGSPAKAAQAAQCPHSTDIPTSTAQADDAADAIVCLVNAERTSHGLRPLRRDGDLAEAARRHAGDMARRNYFAHASPSGETVGDRVRDAGYGDPGDGWKVGEALGWGTGSRGTPDGLVDAWLASPPHRRILLESGYREIGVGVAPGAPLVTHSGLPGATYALNLGVIRSR